MFFNLPCPFPSSRPPSSFRNWVKDAGTSGYFAVLFLGKRKTSECVSLAVFPEKAALLLLASFPLPLLGGGRGCGEAATTLCYKISSSSFSLALVVSLSLLVAVLARVPSPLGRAPTATEPRKERRKVSHRLFALALPVFFFFFYKPSAAGRYSTRTLLLHPSHGTTASEHSARRSASATTKAPPQRHGWE